VHLECCWPGLAQLWHQGHVRSLVISLMFTWSICLLLMASWVWPEWLNVWLVRGFWVVASVVWCFSLVVNHWRRPKLLGLLDRNSEKSYLRARDEYLKGNWFEAEAILLDHVQEYPRDAEALLMLVGVLRHTARWQPAIRRLDQMETLETAAVWRYEIQRERQLIERSRLKPRGGEPAGYAS
jgi:hypothetical protein